MSDFKRFRRLTKENGLAAALMKTLARTSGKRVLIEGLDEDFPRPPTPRDLSMPTPERYNPAGTLTCETARFPAKDGIYAASLFTHLYPNDAGAYMREMHRVLKVGGLAMVSFHDRPHAGERFLGGEHRADYETAFFTALLTEAGFEMVRGHRRRLRAAHIGAAQIGVEPVNSAPFRAAAISSLGHRAAIALVA